VTAAEVLVFEPFLDHNKTAAQRQSGAYSNPSYSTAWEEYSSTLQQLVFTSNTTAGARYKGPGGVLQGGYTCSIRAWSDFENPGFITGTPNFYSHHMDTATQVRVTASATDVLRCCESVVCHTSVQIAVRESISYALMCSRARDSAVLLIKRARVASFSTARCFQGRESTQYRGAQLQFSDCDMCYTSQVHIQ
jgi:hypothetical protein